MNGKIELYFAVLLSTIAILLLHSAFEKVSDNASIKISEFKVLEKRGADNASVPYGMSEVP